MPSLSLTSSMNGYEDAEKRVRVLERTIARTSRTSVEYKDLDINLKEAQRELKAQLIAHAKMNPQKTTNDEDAIMIYDEEQDPSNEPNKRKQQKQLITDKFFQPKTSIKKPRMSSSHPKDNVTSPPITSAIKSNKNKSQTKPQPKSHQSTSPIKNPQTSLSAASKSTHKNPTSATKDDNISESHPPTTSTSQTQPMSYKSAATKQRTYNKHTIRVSLSIPGFQKPGDSKENGILSVVRKLALDLQSVDPSAELLPWNATLDKSYPFIKNEDTSRLSPKQSVPYLKTNIRQCFVANRTHYRQGARITTKYDLDTFLNIWNSAKREIDGMFGISTSETQFHHQHALIGVCVGSSQKKDNTLLLEKLRTITELPTLDGSWQSVMVGDQTKTLWQEAEDRANDEYTSKRNDQPRVNVRSRRFDWAPTGLSLYAPTEVEAKKARAILFSKYGKNVADGVFPQWPDGSRMKFLPLSNKNLSRKSAEKVATRVRFHSYLKAKEDTVDIPDVDPWENIPNSKTCLGIHLHSLVDDKGLPIFRHITKKWTPQPDSKEWQVTCFGSKTRLAQSKIDSLAEDLRSLYGDEAAMFVSISPLRPSREAASDIDDYYEKMTEEETQEFILEPGYQELFMKNEMESMNIMDADSTLMLSEASDTMTIGLSTNTPSKPDEIHDGDEQISPDSSLESTSVGTNTTRSVHFDTSITSADDLTPEDIIRKTIQKYHIDSVRYEELKLKYASLYEEVVQRHNKSTNIVKVFLKMLRTLRIQIRSAEAERPDPGK